MTTLESPTKNEVEMEVDEMFHAGRVSLRPNETITRTGKELGSYSLVATTSAVAFGASANLFAMRWADPTFLLLLKRLKVSVQVVTAITAQRVDALLAYVARGYTARDGTNATAITIATGSQAQKKQNRMGNTLFGLSGNIDVASAAAGVSGGTKTLDPAPFAMMGLSRNAAIAGLGTGVADDLYRYDGMNQHPLILGANEGILIQWGATALATGTATLTVEAEWDEIEEFR